MGAGRLGTALRVSGLASYGLISLQFLTRSRKIRLLCGRPILSVEKLADLIERLGTRMGSRYRLSSRCGRYHGVGGCRGNLELRPYPFQVPEGVLVRSED